MLRWSNIGSVAVGILLPSVSALGFAIAPEQMHGLLAKDGRHGAVVESATVLVLIPPFAYGVWTLLRRRARSVNCWVRLWLALWCLSALYLAGEEASWGQWYFGWATPESFAASNKQKETNLHNMSVWMNHKPQAAAELFISVAGWLMPAWLLLRRRKRDQSGGDVAQWATWVLAPPVLIPAALFHTVTKVCIWLPGPQRNGMGNPELQEFAIALFMALYIMALALRVREAQGHRASAAIPTSGPHRR